MTISRKLKLNALLVLPLLVGQAFYLVVYPAVWVVWHNPLLGI